MNINNDIEAHVTCPLQVTVDLLSGKWKIRILYYLFTKTRRFNELQKQLGSITHRSLTIQLKELEADGLVFRKSYPIVPPKVEYSLTPLGMSLKPVINELYQWGLSYKKEGNKTLI